MIAKEYRQRVPKPRELESTSIRTSIDTDFPAFLGVWCSNAHLSDTQVSTGDQKSVKECFSVVSYRVLVPFLLCVVGLSGCIYWGIPGMMATNVDGKLAGVTTAGDTETKTNMVPSRELQSATPHTLQNVPVLEVVFESRRPTLSPALSMKLTPRLTTQSLKPTKAPSRRPNKTYRPAPTRIQTTLRPFIQTPTRMPNPTPTSLPGTQRPTIASTRTPTKKPTKSPTRPPTRKPISSITQVPNLMSTSNLSIRPENEKPTLHPTQKPTTARPTHNTTLGPTKKPPTTMSSPQAKPLPTPNLTISSISTEKIRLTIGAYYYPWHGADFHKGSPFLREELSPQQLPFLGKYNDTDPVVIAQHLKWSRQANIRLWVTSWWGPGRREDVTTITKILPHIDLGSHKIALFYETNGRILPPDYSLEVVGPDIVHMCENYFLHPNYYTIDNRPVIFVYVTRKYYQFGVLDDILLLMRNAASEYGYNPYIIGDQVFQSAPKGGYAPFTLLDAVTNYDVRGGMNLPGNYVTQSGVDYFYSKQKDWKTAANLQGCAFVPPAVPGYNDRAIRLAVGLPAVSRRLTAFAEEGSLFRATLRGARALADSKTSYLMMINSFNEWHEDSQIEPVVGGIEASAPLNLTQGLEYKAYGELYLNILKEETLS